MDKQQAQNIIRETFENPFDKVRFTNFIKDLLNRIDELKAFHAHGYVKEGFRGVIKTYERIGTYNSADDKKIDIIIVYLQKGFSLDHARVTQRNFAGRYLADRDNKHAGLFAFVSPEESDWRFSPVTIDYEIVQSKAGNWKGQEKFSQARRWSFLVGENENSHTAQSRLVSILANDKQDPTLKEIEKAFDIETVTKEFFLKYRELFLHTKEELDKVVEKDPKIKADFEAKGVDTVNFAKKLLGQIIFLYFLQKKGWFGVGRDDDWDTGSKHFLRELFEKKHSDYNNFFNDILEPLFYDALRNDRSHDDGYYSRFNCKIPFLNGGLFDPIGNYDWVRIDIIIPDKLFSNNVKTKEGDIGTGILDVFDRYNFTVKEDEPLEKEVAIDPELLGKSYEKFNAIRPDNYAEFKKALKSGKKGEENKFNKKFGVYYTPREIVHYMCQQSLINYLDTAANAHKKSIITKPAVQKKIFGPQSPVQQTLTSDLYKPIIPKKDIEKLIHTGEQFGENEARVLRKGKETKTYSHQLPKSIRKNAELLDDKLAEITVCDPAVGSGAFPVGMMSEIVKSRNVLTVFLSNKGRTAYNFKRRCIEHSLYGVDIDQGAVEIAKLRLWLSLVVDENDINNIKPLPNLDYKIVCGNSLLGVEKNLFNFNLFNELEKLKPLFFDETNPTKKQEYKKQIDKLISEITSGHTEFDFEVYFSEVFHNKGGFDVAIANPPYGQLFSEEMKKSLRKMFPELQFKIDAYSVFILKGLNLIRGDGYLIFIIPSAFMDNYFEKNVRKKLLIENSLELVIELDDNVFENAIVHSMILAINKSLPNEEYYVRTSNSNDFETPTQSIPNSYFLKQANIAFDIRSYDQLSFFNKLRTDSIPLSQVIDIRQAIKSGNDKKYISDKKKGLNSKPILGGKNIGKWYLRDPKLYLEYGKHLACPRDYKIFEQPKILIREAGKEIIATYDKDNYYIMSSLYNGILINPSYDLKFILSLINSKLFQFIMNLKTFEKTSGAFTKAKIYHYDDLPIKKCNKTIQGKLCRLVDKILSIANNDYSAHYLKDLNKQAKIKSFEVEINQFIYKLYDLTPEEIKIVEGENENAD